MLTFTSDRCLGLGDLCQRVLEGITAVGKKGKTLGTVIPSFMGTNVHSISIVATCVFESMITID
jgi:hypothetical protein